MKYLLIILSFSVIFNSGIEINLDKGKSSMQILGTSSLHDWEMDVNEFDVAGTISNEAVNKLVVSVTSKSMKSGKSIMDNKAYDAVEEEEYPLIYFKADKLAIANNTISGKGELSIAGETKAIDFSASISEDTEEIMQIKGEVPIKMTDFNISPPTAMFGTLKTGDDVVIRYDIFLIK